VNLDFTDDQRALRDAGADAGFRDGAPVYGYPGLSGCYAQYVTCPMTQPYATGSVVTVDGGRTLV
jgi:hypothetical protein